MTIIFYAFFLFTILTAFLGIKYHLSIFQYFSTIGTALISIPFIYKLCKFAYYHIPFINEQCFVISIILLALFLLFIFSCILALIKHYISNTIHLPRITYKEFQNYVSIAPKGWTINCENYTIQNTKFKTAFTFSFWEWYYFQFLISIGKDPISQQNINAQKEKFYSSLSTEISKFQKKNNENIKAAYEKIEQDQQTHIDLYNNYMTHISKIFQKDNNKNEPK